MKFFVFVSFFFLFILGLASRSNNVVADDSDIDPLRMFVGNWGVLVKIGDSEFKGSVSYTLETGDIWLVSCLKCDLGDNKFVSRSLETFDSQKKAFVEIRVDNNASTPLLSEGFYSKKDKSFTMTGESKGIDGKLEKWKTITKFKDKDSMHSETYVGDKREPTFSVSYKRINKE